MIKHGVAQQSSPFGEPEISIWIDRYDDVFSEFDSRPYSDRALSDDFLREVRKMVSEKSKGEVILKFNVFLDERDADSENIIINNLNSHFRHIAEDLKFERREVMKKGYVLLGFGSALILSLFFVTTAMEVSGYVHGFILMLEPVGWFMTWTGLDHVFQISNKHKSALAFNSKMAHARISFSSLEDQHANPQRKRTVIPFDSDNLRVA